MKIPETITIGGVEWKIVMSKLLIDDECRGKCYKEKREIHVSPDLTDSTRDVTFIHEVLHAIFEMRGTTNDEEFTEEECVTALSPLLAGIIKSVN